jgi:hypothetical protein
MAKIDSGSAFPITNGKYEDCSPGMTLRDWFAGQALTLLGHRSWAHLDLDDGELINVWAVNAYNLADAMLKARGETRADYPIGTKAEAKAAAQSDYEARIKAALVLPPPPKDMVDG